MAEHIDVMISSTSLDLPEHRKQAQQAVIDKGMYPRAMESLTALAHHDAISISMKMVDDAEVYVGIFGQRYGYIPAETPEDKARNPNRLSITEMEYRRAIARGIPVLVFIMSDDHPAPDTTGMTVKQRREADERFFEQTDEGKEKLKALKDELGKKHIAKWFASPIELHYQIKEALDVLFNDEEFHKPAKKLSTDEIAQAVTPPPKRRLLPNPPTLYAHPDYLLTDRFIGRKQELDELTEWVTSRDSVMVFEAIGGMGKSALTWHWVREHASEQGFDGIIWWSLYERGATLEEFSRHALAYIRGRDPDEPDLVEMKYKARTDELFHELRNSGKRYLIVLDGFERALIAYDNINADRQRDDDSTEARDRLACINPTDDRFLQRLQHIGTSKVLISTRHMPKALLVDGDDVTCRQSVRRRKLGGLSPDDARTLMAVNRADKDLQDTFMKSFGYHPLVLKVIASEVRKFPPAPGNFDEWYALHGADVKERIVNLKDSRRNEAILERSLRDLSDDLRELLGKIALFGDTVSHERIQIFNSYMPPLPPRPELPRLPSTVFNPFGSRAMAELKRRYDATRNDEERKRITAEMEQQETRDAEARQQIERNRANLTRELKKALQARKDAWIAYEKQRLRDANVQAAYALFAADLRELQERGLLQFDPETKMYDLHPLVRAIAYNLLPQDVRQSAHTAIISVLDDEGERQREQERRVREVRDLQERIDKYKAIFFSGDVRRAASYFRQKICDTLFYELGDNHTLIRLLDPIFGADSARVVPQLAGSDASYLRHYLALAHNNLLQTERAAALFGQNLEDDIERLQDGDNMVATIYCYAGTSESQNRLAESMRLLELALELAEAVGHEGRTAETQQQRMELFVDMGLFDDAQALYEGIKNSKAAYRQWLFESRLTHTLARSQVYQRNPEAAQTLERLLDIVKKHNMHGAESGAYYLLALHLYQDGKLSEAEEAIENSISRLQSIGRSTAHALALRACITAENGKHDDARKHIQEALKVESLDALKPLIWAHVAHAYLALGDRAGARAWANKAYTVAQCDGAPYLRWYELQRAKSALEKLGEPIPPVKHYDPDLADDVPFAHDVRRFIDDIKSGKIERKKPVEQVDFFFRRIEWLHIGTLAVFGLGEENEALIQRIGEELVLLGDAPTWTNLSYVGEAVPEPTGYRQEGERHLMSDLRLSGVDRMLLDQYFIILYFQSTDKDGKPVYVYGNVRGDRLETLLRDGETDKPKNARDYLTFVAYGETPPDEQTREKLRRDFLFGEHFTNLRIFLDAVEEASKGTTRARRVAEATNQQVVHTVTKFTRLHVGTIASFGTQDEETLLELARRLASLSDVPGLIAKSYVGEALTTPDIAPAFAEQTRFDELQLTSAHRQLLDKVFIILYLTSKDENGNENFAWVNVRGDRLEPLFERERVGEPFNLTQYTTAVKVGQGLPTIEDFERLERDYLFGQETTNLRIYFDTVENANKGTFTTREKAENPPPPANKQPSFVVTTRTQFHLGTVAIFGIDDDDTCLDIGKRFASLSEAPQQIAFSRMGEPVPDTAEIAPTFATQQPNIGALGFERAITAQLSKVFLILHFRSTNAEGEPNFAWVNVRGDRLQVLLDKLDEGLPFDISTYSTLVQVGMGEPTEEQLTKLENDFLFRFDRTNVRKFPPLADVTGGS
jgi:tetratricopeptide (TPR) repeat protein